MPRRAASITQADIARTLRAVAASGQNLRVEVRPGGIIAIVPHEPQVPALAAEPDPDTSARIIL